MGYTFDINLYSDFFKDTYGFRPRNDNFYHPDTTDDQRQDMWDSLLESHRIEMDHEKAREQKSIVEFDKLIQKTISLGAGDRETAIRWISQSVGDDDPGYICYSLGIPYSFENEITLAIG